MKEQIQGAQRLPQEELSLWLHEVMAGTHLHLHLGRWGSMVSAHWQTSVFGHN